MMLRSITLRNIDIIHVHRPPHGNGPLTSASAPPPTATPTHREPLPSTVRSLQSFTPEETRHAMNPENLVATDGVVDNLFSFLMKDHIPGCNDPSQHISIVSLSAHSWISCDDLELIAWPDGIIKCLFRVHVSMHHCGHSPRRIYFFTLRSFDDVDVKDVDTALLLLSKLKNVERVRFSDGNLSPVKKGISRDRPFPVSLGALQSFVHAVPCSFEITTLSSEQWNTIILKSRKGLYLKFGGHNWTSGGTKLIEAMILNQCPTKLILENFHPMSDLMLEAFSAALEVNTSITDIMLSLTGITAKQFVLLIGAIQRNRGLSKLDIIDVPYDCSDAEWDYVFTSLIAPSHPILKSFRLPDFGKSMGQSGECGMKNLLPSLLSNPVAVDTLFSFLSLKYCSYYGGCKYPKFVWLSGHSCICNDYTMEHWPAFRDSHPRSDGTTKYKFQFDVTMLRSTTASSSSPGYRLAIFFFTSRSYEDVDIEDVDTVFLLLSKRKNVKQVCFDLDPASYSPSHNRDGPLPVSRDALRLLANGVPCSFKNTSLSSDQWHTIIFDYHNKSLSLEFCPRNWESGGATLIEAMTLNQGPTKLELRELHLMPNSMFEAFLAALEVNTSIKDVRFALLDITAKQFVLLIDAIQRNRGITTLAVMRIASNDTEWEYLFAALIASYHPTLKSLRLPDDLKQPIRTSLLQALQSNTVLCEIHGKVSTSGSTEEKEIRSILERNQLLYVVQSIIRQNKLAFLATVLCAPDSRHKGDPSVCYQLLRKVIDGGVLFSSSCGQRNKIV